MTRPKRQSILCCSSTVGVGAGVGGGIGVGAGVGAGVGYVKKKRRRSAGQVWLFFFCSVSSNTIGVGASVTTPPRFGGAVGNGVGGRVSAARVKRGRMGGVGRGVYEQSFVSE